jgi:uncharacterized protein (DUF1501 family)
MMIDTRSAATALQAQAQQVQADLQCQDQAWGTNGWTRRRLLKGIGLAGAAALGTQLVTTRVSYAADPVGTNTMIVIFLRGGADGLRLLVPTGSALGGDYLRSVRGPLVQADADLLSLSGAQGWGVNKGFAPLMPLWNSGEMVLVPAVSTAGATRSHFQAQQNLERGGQVGSSTGWLDRTLQAIGPGTTFRAVSEGYALPSSMAGNQQKLSMDSLADFTFPGWMADESMAALQTLYRGDPTTLGADVPTTLSAIGTAKAAQAKAGAQNGAAYPKGDFSDAMGDLATLLRAEVGLQVATVDVGGWDTHTQEAADLDAHAVGLAGTLSAFLTDLGPVRRKRVTVVVMTEFGRRVQMNASNGTDHGTGSVMMLLGGGLNRSTVAGNWTPLSADTLAEGDVPLRNDAFDVLAEITQKRLGAGDLASIFPGHSYAPLNIARTA